jgi:hypothetical protein
MWEKSERQTDRHGMANWRNFSTLLKMTQFCLCSRQAVAGGMNKKIRPFLNKRDRVPSFQLNKT